MITWLASFPKSGNTWLRALLATYFYSNDLNFSFETMSKIYKFPSKIFFKKYQGNIKKNTEVARFWNKYQTDLNKQNKFRIFKTHNALISVDNFYFTDSSNTNGCIYIIRDPRNVITSIMNHYENSVDEAIDFMTNEKSFLFDKEKEKYINFQLISSWSNHYKSWVNNKSFPVLTVKYEDLENNTLETFQKVINFIIKLGKLNISFDNKKAIKVIDECNFYKLRKKEINEGFNESPIGQKTGKKRIFFNLGAKNDYKKILNKETIRKLNEIFKEDLKKWGYS